MIKTNDEKNSSHDNLIGETWFVLIVCAVMMTGCATNKTNEAYYEPEVYEENYGPYSDECYCKGPTNIEIQAEDQR